MNNKMDLFRTRCLSLQIFVIASFCLVLSVEKVLLEQLNRENYVLVHGS